MHKIMVVGGLPEPVGGVTNFIYRMANVNMISKVVDLYPSSNKNIPANFHGEVFLFKSFFTFILKWIFCKRFLRNIELIHFNFSTPRSLLLPFFIPKKGCKFALMLHHGELVSYAPSFLVKMLIGKFDKIYFLSEKQADFYKENGVDKSRLIKKTSYIPSPQPDLNLVDADVKEIVKLIKEKGKYCVIGGYCTEIYNHHWVVDLFSSLEQERDLLVFLYGDLNNEYFSIIQNIVSNNPRITLFLNRSADSFNYALSFADIYLRPNSKDSFGIAVADAVSFGTKVLASDVCKRYPGAYLFKPSSYDDFLIAYNLFIQDSPILSTSTIEDENYVFYYD